MNSVELLMNVTPNETRVALVETGVLKEVHIERQAKRGIVGNIYKGRVTRVLPGMQSAFVDIGLEKAAFLHASDIVSHTEGVGPACRSSVPCAYSRVCMWLSCLMWTSRAAAGRSCR